MLNEGFNDIVLSIENEEIPAISSILCVSNQRLKSIIKDEKVEDIITLPELITKKAFLLLTTYYGYGSIGIAEENVCELLLCCISLNEYYLFSECRKYILSHLNNRLTIDILNLYEYIPEYYLNDINTTICDYIRLNCISVLDDIKVFQSLHLDNLKFIITLENLLIPSEKYLLEKILKHYHENGGIMGKKDEEYNEVMKYLNWKEIDIREIDKNDLDLIDMNIMKKCISQQPIKRKYGKYANTGNKNKKIDSVNTYLDKEDKLLIMSKMNDEKMKNSIPPPPLLKKEYSPLIHYSFDNPNINYKINSSQSSKVEIELRYSTFSCSVIRCERIEKIDFNGRSFYIPNYVYYDSSTTDISVGLYEESKSKNGQCIKYPINIIGLNYSDPIVQNEIKNSPVTIVNDNGIPKYEIKYNNKIVRLSARDVLSEIFKYIKKHIDDYCDYNHRDKLKVNVSIPINFNDKQIQDIRDSAINGNINIVKFIPIPITICFSHYKNYKNNSGMEKILICDIDNSNFQSTILKVDFKTKSMNIINYEDLEIGGDMFINKLVEYFLNKYKEEIGESRLNPQKILELKRSCEEVEKVKESDTNFEIDCSFLEENEIDTDISLSLFIHLCGDLFKKMENNIRLLIRKCSLSENDICRIILNNNSNIKIIKSELQKRFGIKIEECNGSISSLIIE